MRRLGFAGLGMLALAAACGPDKANDPPLRADHKCLPGVCLEAAAPPPAGDSGSGNAPLEPWPDANAGPRSGIYASLAVVDATVAVIKVTLKLLFRLRLLQTGTTTKQSTTLCAFQLPSVPGVATLSIPPLLQAVIQKNSVVVSEGDYLTANGSYTPPPFLLVLGARLKNPATDPLPTLTDLTGQWDEDKEGNPGVTVDATVATCTATQSLYVALRTGGTLSGRVTGPDTIDGTMNLFEEESVLGYSDPCLSLAANIMPKLLPNSRYHAQRVADEATLDTTGNITCEEIVAKAPTLFGSDWQ